MSNTLGKVFRKNGQAVRYLYKGGKKAGKVLVHAAEMDSKSLKRGARRFVVAGVTYYVWLKS